MSAEEKKSTGKQDSDAFSANSDPLPLTITSGFYEVPDVGLDKNKVGLRPQKTF